MSFQPPVAASIGQGLGGEGGGTPADRPDLHGDLPGLPAALGRGVAKVHATPVPPTAEPVDLAAAISARLDADAIAPAALPEPYDRYEAGRLVEIWNDWSAPAGYEASDVCLIGAPTLDRFLLDGGDISAISGAFGLVGDRHLDLAVVQHSVHAVLGAEAVFGFYEAYGADPNIVVLDHYVLAGLLLGWIE